MAGTYLLSGQKERRKMVRRTAYCEVNVMAEVYLLSGQKERRKMVRRTEYCEVKVIAEIYLLSGQKERRKMVRRTAYCEVNVMAGTTCWLPVRYGLCTIDLRRHHALSLIDISIAKKLREN